MSVLKCCSNSLTAEHWCVHELGCCETYMLRHHHSNCELFVHWIFMNSIFNLEADSVRNVTCIFLMHTYIYKWMNEWWKQLSIYGNISDDYMATFFFVGLSFVEIQWNTHTEQRIVLYIMGKMLNENSMP